MNGKFASFAVVLLSGTLLHAHPLRADVLSAKAALQNGRASEAAALLRQTISTNAQNPEAHQLLCRVYYAEELTDAAIRECGLAAAQAPGDSNTAMWLGRAYGLKAEHAGLITAYQLAKKVRASFERAVQLDPGNGGAVSDLGEYYVDAPSMLGGGDDKALALASRMKERFPAQAHRLLALVALDNGDTTKAEAEFKAAVRSDNAPEAYIDLAHFYEKHDRLDDAVTQIQAGIAADTAKDAVLVDAASILIRAHRDPDLAEHLLREYLASSAKSDAAPAFRVHVQLGNLLKLRNDPAGARNEYVAAAALAPDYAPAKRAIQAL